MKKVKSIVMATLAFALAVACAKEHSSNTADAKLISNKSSVKAGDQVYFKVQNGPAGALAKWTVTPNTNVNISRAVSWDQGNTITFNQPGNYAVNVELKKVWCDSVAAANPGMDTCINGGTVAGKLTTNVLVSN